MNSGGGITRSPRRRGRAASVAPSRPSAFAVFRVDHELDLDRLHHWQVGRSRTFEDAAGVAVRPGKTLVGGELAP